MRTEQGVAVRPSCKIFLAAHTFSSDLRGWTYFDSGYTDANYFTLVCGPFANCAPPTPPQHVRAAERSCKHIRKNVGGQCGLRLPCLWRFFHHNVTGPQAEERMLSVASKPGTFLVRESQRQYDCFVLSVVVGKQGVKVLHVTITFQVCPSSASSLFLSLCFQQHIQDYSMGLSDCSREWGMGWVFLSPVD